MKGIFIQALEIVEIEYSEQNSKKLRRDGETYFFFFYKGNYIKCPKTKDNKIRLLFLWKMV